MSIVEEDEEDTGLSIKASISHEFLKIHIIYYISRYQLSQHYRMHNRVSSKKIKCYFPPFIIITGMTLNTFL